MNGGRDASPTQRKLEELKIDRNGVDNGIALSPGFHGKVHTKAYYDYIRDQLEEVNTKQGVIDRLQEIGRSLQEADQIYQQTGRLPDWLK